MCLVELYCIVVMLSHIMSGGGKNSYMSSKVKRVTYSAAGKITTA